MKRIVGVIAIVAGLLMLSGCGGSMSESEDSNVITDARWYSVVSVDVGSTTVPCVFYVKGGVSCDWNE